MDPILSVAAMQQVDAESRRAVDALMDAAGYGIALSAVAMGVGYGSVVHVIAGPGNNGGDGYVAARYLKRRGATVTVHYHGTPDPESAAGRAMSAARVAGVRLVPLGSISDGDLVIDALYGTGFRGHLPDEVLPWIAVDIPVLAVDIPSGVSGDTGNVEGPAFTAQRTATFHALKTGHLLGAGPDRSGVVDVYDIGLAGGEASMYRFTADDVVVPRRGRAAHKWSAGAVATIGGVPGLTGAAVLAARSALAAGAGVSSILTTAATASTYETLAPDLIAIQASETNSWRDHESEVLALLGRYDTLIIGPGLEPVSTVFVERTIRQFDGVVVIDAGALNALARLDVLVGRTAPTVLTPHAGEFRRLTGDDPTPEAARWLAETTGAVVILKGNPTFVTGDRQIVVGTGGPELASIGTGDVLTGIVGAFTAAGIPALVAAASAAYLHGVAGRRLATRRTVTAPELVAEVGAVVSDFGNGHTTSRST
ncbi:MAG: bifunctional ADP-dependent NAD(P)H-hydrate dehydratase/NAD(P)H-hydrate epimerase [Acidimicrobiia bacterium]|nr:MAG: bifunctional ADP-dependent NAD(P)H-hydrate dehydratase/NAD(P)H-hydrate epimerase [Acidimicrobiia bacterium]